MHIEDNVLGFAEGKNQGNKVRRKTENDFYMAKGKAHLYPKYKNINFSFRRDQDSKEYLLLF